MRSLFALFILLAVMIASCGPNAQDQAANQRKINDSVATVAKANLLAKQVWQNKLDTLNNELIKANADLEAAYDEMVHIKRIQSAQPSATLGQQIRDQDMKISRITVIVGQLDKDIIDAQRQVALYDNYDTYYFSVICSSGDWPPR